MEVDAFDIFDNSEVKREFSQAFDKLDSIEAIQLLSDLKYLPLKAFEDKEVSQAEMQNAIQRYRIEYLEALSHPEMSNLKDIHFDSEIIEFQENSLTELTNRELYILKELTGLDKQLIISQINIDEISLLSRILLYRYRIYSLTNSILPNYKLTSEVRDKLQEAAKSVGYQGDWISFGNTMAKQHELSNFCLTSKVLKNSVFGDGIFIMAQKREGRKVFKKLGARYNNKSLFLQTIGASASTRTISDLINFDDRTRVENQVNSYIKGKLNDFMSRMLQVKLWMMGLYQGKLDNYFGPLSINALIDYLMSLVEKPINGKKELGKILYYLGNNQCVINIRYLLENHIVPLEKSNVLDKQYSVSQIFNYVLEDKMKISSFGINREAKLHRKTNTLNSSLATELRKESQQIINKDKAADRRQYKAKKGVMKFFSKLFDFLKDTYRTIQRFIDKLIRLVKKAARLIYDEIREAFQHFKNGLHFLFGNRIVNPTLSITTDYDSDFDGITIVHKQPTLDELKMHTQKIKSYSSAIYPTLNFVKKVVKWGLKAATGPIGWVQILVGIAKLFREMISKQAATQRALRHSITSL